MKHPSDWRMDKMNKTYMLCLIVVLLLPSRGSVLVVEAHRIRGFADGAAYYNYRDHSIWIDADKLQSHELYNFYIDLDGNHTSSTMVYSQRTKEFGLTLDIYTAYMTPDGCLIQFTRGAFASETEGIEGFPCVMRAIKKELISGEQVDTPVGEYFKWTLTKYSPPTNGIAVLHASNGHGRTLPIYRSFYYSIDDGATWTKIRV